MNYLTLEEILILHEFQIEIFDGKPGISDIRMLESAVLRPQTTFDGEDLYPGVYEKATALCYAVIKNHPFIDGNKRTGLHAMLTFLRLNNVEDRFTDDELVVLGLGIANDRLGEQDILSIVKKKTVDKGIK